MQPGLLPAGCCCSGRGGRVKLTAGRAAAPPARGFLLRTRTHTHVMEHQQGQEGKKFSMPQDSLFPRIVLTLRCFVLLLYFPPEPHEANETQWDDGWGGEAREQGKQRGQSLTSQQHVGGQSKRNAVGSLVLRYNSWAQLFPTPPSQQLARGPGNAESSTCPQLPRG